MFRDSKTGCTCCDETTRNCPVHCNQKQPWRGYRKNGVTEMRPYIPGEDLSGVSVSPADTPKVGDMIARNPAKPGDFWLVAKEYFDANYEPA